MTGRGTGPLTGGILAVAAAALVTGCGGQPSAAAPGPVTSPAPAATPAPAGASPIDRTTTPCAAAARPAGLPADFPADFPLPPRAVVTGSERRSGSRLIVTAVSPDGVKTVLAHFQSALPKAGLTNSAGEVEALDAESDFSGPAYQGRWTLRDLPGCPADTLVTVLVAPR